MELDGLNFVNAVLDHFRAEAVNLSLLGYTDLTEVFKHQWNDGFGWWCRDNRTAVADGLTEIRQRAAVV